MSVDSALRRSESAIEIKGIVWVGSSTDEREAMTEFFSGLLGLTVAVDVRGFTRLRAANGDRVELFGPESVEHDQLDTGPVAGFWVDDLEAAREELLATGSTECSEIQHGPDGHGWFYFRAPDGRFYELCEHNSPRPVKGS